MTFQRLMDQVLAPVKEFTGAYIDDILIYSKTWEEHVKHIQEVLKEIERAGLKVNPKKCKIARKGVQFLGFHVEGGKIQPVSDKVNKVVSWEVPKNKKEVQQFLGLAGYYRQFVPNFAEVAATLTDLTKKKKGKGLTSVSYTHLTLPTKA